MSQSFSEFCLKMDPSSKVKAGADTISFSNRNGLTFTVPQQEITAVLRKFLDQNDAITAFILNHEKHESKDGTWGYREKVFRAVFDEFFSGDNFSNAYAAAKSQAKSLMSALSQIVGWSIGSDKCGAADQLLLDRVSLSSFFEQPRPWDALTERNPNADSRIVESFREICAFCKSYNSEHGGWTTSDERVVKIVSTLAQVCRWLEQEYQDYRGVRFVFSFAKGQGWYSKIPFICILPPGQETNDGVYVAICFGKEGAGAVAGFAESVQNRRGLPIVKRTENRPLLVDVDGPIQSVQYNDCFVNPLELFADSISPAELKAHVAASLDLCIDFLKLKKMDPFGPRHRAEFLTALRDSGFRCGDVLPTSFVNALATKPFVILTGNSGTGKTKIAEQFAIWLSEGDERRMAIVPIGADWTDNRNVLGFVNHLRLTRAVGESVESPMYQSTKMLDLLLEASAVENRNKSYLLILDEMNLSHVERYFGDFLSAMESRDGRFLLHREGRLLARVVGGKADVPEELLLPSNVFVVGTVNVDETTYMFSPKVLDRANVLEFRLDADAAMKFLQAGGSTIAKITSAPLGYSEAFLRLSFAARGLNGVPPLSLVSGLNSDPVDASPLLEKCNSVIADIFSIMQQRHQEFAFRSLTEIVRYLAVDYELSRDKDDWDWQSALDAQILQKILPKLHGSKRKIGALLAALATYCENGDAEVAAKPLNYDATADAYPVLGSKVYLNPMFPESHRKLCEMIQSVSRDQFVSFIQ